MNNDIVQKMIEDASAELTKALAVPAPNGESINREHVNRARALLTYARLLLQAGAARS